MVRTRKQVRETGETQSQDSSSSNKRRREEEAAADSDEELVIPVRAIRGRYKQGFIDAYENFVELVHKSPLPYFKDMIKNKKEALEAFILACAEIFYADEGIEDERDESEIEASADEKATTSEEEFVDEGETEDDDELADELDALEDHSSDVIAASLSEVDEDEELYDDDEVEKIGEEDE